MSGRFRHKFAVSHWRRGRLDPDDCFVLIPARDPAAVAAVRAYARVTPDAVLAADLTLWVDQIEGVDTPPIPNEILYRIRVWTAVLSSEVRAGTMDLETALQRIAGHTAALLGEPC